jgi:hypothetical protein
MRIVALIVVFIFSFGFSEAQNSRMDLVEREIKVEYQLHNLDYIVDLAFDIVNSTYEKGKTPIGDRIYKFKVKTVSSPVYYAYGGNSISLPPKYYVDFISKSRSYRVYIKGDIIKVSSGNLSFSADYNIKKGEVTLVYKECDGSFGKELQLFGFTYKHDRKIGEKLEDWKIGL